MSYPIQQTCYNDITSSSLSLCLLSSSKKLVFHKDRLHFQSDVACDEGFSYCLSFLWQDFPTLLVKADDYTHSDGHTLKLLQIEGTLPMWYQVRARSTSLTDGVFWGPLLWQMFSSIWIITGQWEPHVLQEK